MSGFKDIHAHFVYGLDDGAQTQEEMKAMLDAAHADGIAFLFATPHVTPGIEPYDEAVLNERLASARAYCQCKGYDMVLCAGAEIMYTPMLRQYALDKRLPALAGTNVILLECSPRIAYDELDQAVGLLERCGYDVILAHIERYGCLHGRNAYRLKQAHDMRYQINTSAIVKDIGFWRKRAVRKWLKDELIDHVATDSHNCHSRKTNMTEAYRLLCQQVDRAYADRLVGLT